MDKEVYIGLGSNIEPRVRHLMRALDRLSRVEGITVESVSSVYSSAAHTLDDSPQPDFLNAVAKLSSPRSAAGIMEACHAVESMLGRMRSTTRWKPRPIDIDLLMCGTERIESELLTVPHPHLSERLFVLVPLSEVWPAERELPVLGKTVAALIEDCPDRGSPMKTIVSLGKYA